MRRHGKFCFSFSCFSWLTSSMLGARSLFLLTTRRPTPFHFSARCCFFWFYWYVNQSLVLPVTLDFAASMGQSATMSGFFVSSPLATSIAGLQVGKMIIGENAWDQASARRLIIWAPLVSVMLTAIEAAVSNSVVHFDLPAKRASFWVILALSNLAAFIVALPYVPLMVMWAKFTPKREMTFWMIMAQCSRQSGFLVGPAVFALLSQLVGRGKPIAPASALAWVLVAQVIIGYCSVMLHSMALPAQLPDDVERMEEDSSPGSLDGVEDSVDSLDILEREQVVASMIWYSFERSFVTAAIEVSTIMLLEVSYGWPSERCGLVFTVVSSTSLLLTWLSSMVMSRNSVPESTVFMVCKLTSLVGVIFLFDFGIGPAGLLLADSLVYGCASVSNGIAQGWGSKAAVPNTTFSIEVYRTYVMSLECAAHFLAPVVARSILDFGGQNIYALVQLCMTALSTATVYKAVKMVWALQGLSDPKNGKEV
ncbi:unnamed protein product [Durusdinium trenchii]|uniref:Solute carrier family 40 protein n=1 Tax=Durusdinium trenchii TaxID=1381693 RepID=A0ABP0MT72_9DINO